MNELKQLLTKYDYMLNDNGKYFDFVINLAGYGCVEGDFNFESNKFVVSLAVDEDEYRGFYFIPDDEDVDEDELDEWNTTNTHNTITKAIQDVIDTIETVNSECDGVLDKPILFIEELQLIKFE